MKDKIYCKNCKHFIGLNASLTKHLCWIKKERDYTGQYRKGEFCDEKNMAFNCPDYKKKWYLFRI